MKYISTLGILITLYFVTAAQSTPSSIRQKCNEDLNALNGRIKDLNNEYENIKSDLKAGFYCSKCGSSKTELDKIEGFYKHLNNVKGQAVAATAQQMSDAHQRYLQKYNALKSSHELKSKSCDENYRSAVDAANDKQQADFANARQKQQAEAKATADAEKQQQLDTYKKQQEELREAERRREERQRLVAAAGNQLMGELSSNSEAKQDALDAYRQNSALDADNLDSKDKARIILASGDNPDDLFGSPFNNGIDNSDINSETSNIKSLINKYREYQNSLKENVTQFLGRRFSHDSESEEIPTQGWSFENTRLNRRIIEPVKNLFNLSQKKLNEIRNNPQVEEYVRYYELFKLAQPKTNEETRNDLESSHDKLRDRISPLIDQVLKDGYESNVHGDPVNDFGEEVNANVAGNLAGQSNYMTQLKNRWNESTLGEAIDRLFNAFKKD